MDLGTICKNLERGAKYRNSRDVYEDVQLVWDNCRSYNQKGDPILDLLVRVKKNFTKYWTAAGLSTERNSGFTPLYTFSCKEIKFIIVMVNINVIYMGYESHCLETCRGE